MKTPLGLLLALVATLVLAAPAYAKQITKATIWGASGSTTIDDPAQLRLLPFSGAYVTDPPKVAPFYTIDVAADAGQREHHVIMLYVPSAQRVAGVSELGGLEWLAVESPRARMLDAAAADLEPYEAGAWPPGLKSIEQISFLAGATVRSTTVPSDGLPWTYLLAAVVASGAFAASGLLLWRRRFSAREAHPRPA